MWKYHQICFNLQQYSYCFEIIFKKIAKKFSRKYVFLERRQEICRIFIRRAKRNKKKNYNKQRETKLTAITAHRPTTQLDAHLDDNLKSRKTP